MLFYLVLFVHVIVSLLLIGVVLLQSGRSGDIASAFGGGGGSQAVFGPRATSNVLTRATSWSAGVFMVTSLLLVFLSQGRSGGSRLREASPSATPPVSSAPASPGSTIPAGQSKPSTPAPQNSAPQGSAPKSPAPGGPPAQPK